MRVHFASKSNDGALTDEASGSDFQGIKFAVSLNGEPQSFQDAIRKEAHESFCLFAKLYPRIVQFWQNSLRFSSERPEFLKPIRVN